MGLLRIVCVFVRAWVRTQAHLAAENLALRQQLAVLHGSVKRPRLRRRDRLFWVVLSRLWQGWQIVEAFPWAEAPRYMIRDRDSIYGQFFRQRV